MNNKNAKFLVFLLFLLVVAIPVSFANDTLTNETLSISDGDEIIGANDVYFNASAISDGLGSRDNPYKSVSSSRLGSINHFASGTYNVSLSLSALFSSSSMTFIGEDRDTTILDYHGSDTFLSSSSDLTFSSITLKGVHIISTGGLLTATNTVFENGIAPIEEESDYNYYDNSYGGAIKQSISSSGIDWGNIFGGSSTTGMKIIDCIFRNNHADYGGAIYVEGGTCEITNTTFESNHAKNHGGSISAMNDVKLTVDGCEFDSDYSNYDAGGAIYAFNCSNVIIKNSDFNNCSATFGSAITSVESTLSICNSNARKNRASWQGGAIYAMYGSLTLMSSNFYENHAKNGGAVFADNLTSFEVDGGEFKSNTASDAAGAIFAFTNKINKITANYSFNSASRFDDLYQTNSIDLIMGSDDYEMVMCQPEYNGVLPSRYDLRSLGYVTPVKNQGNSGNCWAFATMATLESALLKACGKQYNLSEGNLKNLACRYSDIGWDYETNNGGMYPFAFGYLTSWAGPVNATLDPTDDWDILAPILNSEVHIQNILFLQRTSFTDNSAIKRAIMDYGAVGSEIYWSNSYLHGNDYYYSGNEGRNHAVCVVGWDDARSVSGAPGTGAWIVKNSYGIEHGDGGYYYVSYYDKSLFRVYDESYNSFAIVFNDTKRFNKNYQYDAAFTDYFITGNKQMWYKNTFTATGNDILEAFSTYFRRVTSWEAQIFVNDELRLTQYGKNNFGYYTIDLETPIALKTGDNFTISLKITCNANADIPISESGPQYTLIKQYFKPGISFFSSDGISWTDFHGYVSSYGSGDSAHNYYNQVACIKAFTSKGVSEVLNTSILIDNVNSRGVSVKVFDQLGRKVNVGVVEFSIGTEKYVANVLNGEARVNLTLNAGIHSIGVIYLSNDYYNSSSDFKRIGLDKQTPTITIECEDVVYPNNLTVNVKVTNENEELINVPLAVQFNGETYTQNEFSAGNLKPGNYTVIVTTQAGDDYYSSSKDKVVTVHKASPILTLESPNVYVGEAIVIKAKLSYNITSYVKVNLNMKTYEIGMVGGEGFIIIDNNLDGGDYLLYGESESDDYYLKAASTSTLHVSKINPNLTVLSNDSAIVVYLPSDIADALALVIDNNTFTSNSSDGEVMFEVPNLSPGYYDFSVLFKGNGRYNEITVYGNLNISKVKEDVLLTINADDSTRAYLSGNDYQATFTDGHGNLLANAEVLFVVNGNEYYAKTNRFGVAKLNAGFAPGTFEIVIFNPVTSQNVTKSMTIVKRIGGNAGITIDYSYASSYRIRLYADNGNPVGAGEVVTFKINGKTAKVITNSYGYAIYKISGLLPKTYAITAEYKGSSVSNKVVVKQILKSKNFIFKKSAKNKRISATLKTSAGKAIKGKKITFKINGKTYVAKTNSKGVATVKLTNLKRIGKYSLTVKYLKTSIKKKITIKK